MRNPSGSASLPAERWRAMLRMTGLLVIGGLLGILPAWAQEITNEMLSVKLDAKGGSYQIARRGEPAVLASGVAARVNGEWLRCRDYPRHEGVESPFRDALGTGREITLTCSGKKDAPDLVLAVQLYEKQPYGAVTVKVRNAGMKDIIVQAIRSVEATGDPLIHLGGALSAVRVLSDSFSEDWPDMKIY